MNELSPDLLKIVRTAMSGKRLEKFNESVKILNDSLRQGSWSVLRASVKAESGFYQGFFKRADYGIYGPKRVETAYYISHTLNFGSGHHINMKFFPKGIAALRKYMDEHVGVYGPNGRRPTVPLTLTDEQVEAWVKLCIEKNIAIQLLQIARPQPQITKVGLSPKVTKTLKEMDIDIDLSTIKMAYKNVKKPLVIDGKQIYHPNGTRVLYWATVVHFPHGTKFGMTRFSDNAQNCEACGKYIPSGKFVPITAEDRKSGKLLGLWLGCDCARNIFGVKDLGFNRPRK